jgi:hypothetical protein
MILVVCTDDNKLVQKARSEAQRNPGTFGAVYIVFEQVPPLQTGENLFITAHGAKRGDDGNPVIGDKSKAFYVNAVDLYRNLQSIFPAQYAGNVYISACESADNVPGSFSFAEVFKAQIGVKHGRTRVYGQTGAVGLEIPLQV